MEALLLLLLILPSSSIYFIQLEIQVLNDYLTAQGTVTI